MYNDGGIVPPWNVYNFIVFFFFIFSIQIYWVTRLFFFFLQIFFIYFFLSLIMLPTFRLVNDMSVCVCVWYVWSKWIFKNHLRISHTFLIQFLLPSPPRNAFWFIYRIIFFYFPYYYWMQTERTSTTKLITIKATSFARKPMQVQFTFMQLLHIYKTVGFLNAELYSTFWMRGSSLEKRTKTIWYPS